VEAEVKGFQKMGVAMLLLCISTGLFSSKAPDRRTSIEGGGWSSQSISLLNTWGALDDNPNRVASFKSPDGKKTVFIHGRSVSIEINGKKYETELGDLTNPELGWAPDSNRFFVTWTDGGELGTWHVDVYAISSFGLTKESGVERSARRDFEERARQQKLPKGGLSAEACSANVVGSKWAGTSDALFVAVLFPNTSRCRWMGHMEGYEIAIPTGKIQRHLTDREFRRVVGKENSPKTVE
jgi:hypothetical protein